MNIRFTRTKTKTDAFFRLKAYCAGLLVFSVFCLSFACVSFTYAASSKTGLSEEQLKVFGQNDILFYDPSQCVGGTSSGVCGSTAEEKIWSILRQTLDPIHAAAAFGSIANEGGFQPVKWEYGNVVSLSTCDFVSGMSWDDLYNGVYDGRYGVGSFGLTSGLSDYLHYINDTAPDLLQYFKDPSNTCLSTGDELAEKIGEGEYDRLIELEVNYFINEWIGESRLNAFKAITDLEEAAIYWAHSIEVCAACGYDQGDSQLAIRASAARGYYEQYKDFTCTASSSSYNNVSSSTSAVSGDQITWIGDSGSALAHDEEGYGLVERSFPGVDYGPTFNDSTSYIQSCKGVRTSCTANNPSGLEILERIIEKGTLRPYLVFDLGSNGGWDNSMVEDFLDLVGDDTQVILVASGSDDDDYYAGINSTLRSMAQSHPNIHVADMAAKYKREYFDESGIEYSIEGSKVFIETIKEALSAAAGDGCTTYDGEYPEYLQGEEPWGSMPYGTGTMADSGCGAASMAMLATVATGQDIYPNDIADLLGNQYYDSTSVHVLDPIVGDHYGFEVIKDDSSSVEETKTKFRQYLKDGYMIHFTGAGCYPGFQSGNICSNGHVIGIFSIDDNDVVMQANSGWGGNQESSLDDIAKAKTWSAFTAIKGNGNSGKNTCSGLCKSSSGSIGLDGLTEEQAQKIADYYNSSQVTASNFIGGSIPSDYAKVNCVSFSYWFVSAFTDAAEISPIPSLVGDGSYIADTGLPSIGWETGNDPTPFSVFGGAGSSAWSHTGVVVGSAGDDAVITIEAAYAAYDARVMTRPLSYFSSGVGILAYPGDHLTPGEGHLGNKSLLDIIGD